MEIKIETLISYFLLAFYAFLNLGNAQRRDREPPVVVTPPDPHVAKFEGESYLASCRARDNSPVQWMDPRNLKIPNQEQSRIRTENSFDLELYINQIRMEDAGMYVCITRQARVGFNLTVVRPITFDTSLAIQTAKEGHPHELKCSARGHSSQPKIAWKIDHRPPSGRFTALPNGNLRISRVLEQDSRSKYVCRATEISSPRPDMKDMAIKLKVQTKPRIPGQPHKDQYGVENSYANLTCTAIAEPPAKFEWYFMGRKLTTSQEVLIFNQQENVSNLQIFIGKPQLYGDYVCKAMNPMGWANQTLKLRRAKKPGVPTLKTLELGSVGIAISGYSKPDQGRTPNDPAVESGRRAEELPVKEWVVQYKMPKTRPNWAPAPNITQTSYGFIMRNLVPNVTYIIRAAAKNQAAQGEFSPELTFTTPRNVPFNPPLNHAGSLRASTTTMGILVTLTALYLSSTSLHLIQC